MRKILFRLINMTIYILPLAALKFIWNIFDNSESKIALYFRYFFMEKYCKKVDGFIFIGKNTNIKNYHNLSLGSNVSIHSFCYIDAFGGITIGDNVSIASHCTLISSDHTWTDINIPIKFNKIEPKPINIQSDVWIATGCRILGNVNISDRSVIGAGAVVNKNVDRYSIYVGVPAIKVKKINI